MNYYQFHIADFALHTSHLTLEEEGVYRRLLDYYYDTERAIPKETKSVIRRLRLGSYEVIVQLVLEEFFVLKEDGWHNLRADGEITEYQSKADRARKNGKKGGRPKKSDSEKSQKNQRVEEIENLEKTQSVISGMLPKSESKANQEPITINHKPINTCPNQDSNDSEPDLINECFERFWSSGIRKDARKKTIPLFTKILKKQSDPKAFTDKLVTDIRDRLSIQQFGFERMLPTTYLNGERWNDQLTRGDPILSVDHANKNQTFRSPHAKQSLTDRAEFQTQQILSRCEAGETDNGFVG